MPWPIGREAHAAVSIPVNPFQVLMMGGFNEKESVAAMKDAWMFDTDYFTWQKVKRTSMNNNNKSFLLEYFYYYVYGSRSL